MVMTTALATLITGLVASGVSALATSITNKKNAEINQQNLDYAKSTTQEQWERDDIAHQREVKDLEAAGLSPLANTTGSQVTGANMPSSMIGMQAPQIDVNSLLQAVGQVGNLNMREKELEEDKRHNQEIEKNRSTELANQATQLQNQAEELQIENKKVEENIKVQAKLAKIEADRLAEVVRSNQKNENLTASAQESLEIERESKRYYTEILKQSGGKDIPYKEYSHNFQAYINAKQIYDAKFQVFISKIGATQSANGKSYGYNQADSFGLGAGANVVATGGNGNFNWSETTGENNSQYSMENLSKKQEAMLEAWHKENPIPIWIDKSKYKYHSEGRY